MRRLAFAALAALVLPVAACDDGDDVIIPDEADLVVTADRAGHFATFTAAIDAAGLTRTLSDGGPYTVFAPTDAAFETLPDGELDRLFADRAALAELVMRHVASGNLGTADLRDRRSVATDGATFAVATEGSAMLVGPYRVVTRDLVATNGVIHGIDGVFLGR